MRRQCSFAAAMLLSAGSIAGAPDAAAQERSAPVPRLALAEQAGAWVVELTRVEGLGLMTETIAVSSTGDMRCDEGPRSCDMQIDVVSRIASILSAHPATPAAPWSDKRLLLCSDCPVITLNVHVRENDGSQLVVTYRWTSVLSGDVPEFAIRIHSAIAAAAGR
jgi:hypothetical protein